MYNVVEDISADLTAAGGSNFSASLFVPADGLYELELSYSAVSEKNATVSLTIDGGLPFDEADRLVFPIYWRDGERKAPDAQGNEFSPDIIAVSEPVSSYAMDYSGHFEGAFRFALSAGSHTVNLKVKSGEINIHSLTFKAPADIKSYSKKQIRENLSLSEPVVIEGEDAVLKNKIPAPVTAFPYLLPLNQPLRPLPRKNELCRRKQLEKFRRLVYLAVYRARKRMVRYGICLPPGLQYRRSFLPQPENRRRGTV